MVIGSAPSYAENSLQSRHERSGWRERRLYEITPKGLTVLQAALVDVKELVGELFESESTVV
jgi:PadR family transcriptional regulator, regulatory protein PadR